MKAVCFLFKMKPIWTPYVYYEGCYGKLNLTHFRKITRSDKYRDSNVSHDWGTNPLCISLIYLTDCFRHLNYIKLSCLSMEFASRSLYIIQFYVPQKQNRPEPPWLFNFEWIWNERSDWSEILTTFNSSLPQFFGMFRDCIFD